jgi:hypothetical protein
VTREDGDRLGDGPGLGRASSVIGWHDEPIANDADDAFGRIAIADHLARLLADNHTWEASRVYGLIGPWGSGKTSVINMVCDRLRRAGAGGQGERWVVARFTPWATSSSDALLVEFYSSLSAALGRDPGSKRARKLLGGCMQAAAPMLNLVPHVGPALVGPARAGGKLLARQKPWERAFADFTRALAKMRVRVLVVADDVDRLQPDELATLLKVVRLLGRFPGVDYLLAYDEATLFANLPGPAAGTGRARLFMEKIVQYPLALPPLLAHQVLNRFHDGLTAALQDRPGTPPSYSRLEGLQDLLVRQLDTPRSIDRYLAQVRFVLSMHTPGETDTIDLLLVTLLHVQFPTVYSRLPVWRGRLTGHKSISDLLRPDSEQHDFTPLFAGLEGDQRDDAFRLVRELFRIVDGQGPNNRGAPHISDHFYFDRYLVHMVPDDDIADAAITAALAEARRQGPGAAALSDLLTNEAVRGLPDLALMKLQQASEPNRFNPPEATGTLNLVAAICHVLPQLPDGPNPLRRRWERAARWAAEQVCALPTDVEPDALQHALASCSDLLLRQRVVEFASRGPEAAFDDGWPAEPGAIAVVAGRVADEVATFCLEHLAAGDAADPTSDMISALTFVVDKGDAERLRVRLREQLGDRFTSEDLASRCVARSVLIAAEPVVGLEDLVAGLFSRLVPLDDPFYDTVREDDVDRRDLSWANRRRFARGRAVRPAPPEPEAHAS